MRPTRFISAVFVAIIAFAAFSLAALNKYGVADVQQLTLTNSVKVGEVVLPKGDYKVEHSMQGEEHIMVFTQLHTKNPITAKAKCQLVKLEAKAEHTQVLYNRTDPSAPVLQELVFRGETAKHVF